MPYDATKDPNRTASARRSDARLARTGGYTKSVPITPSDTVDLAKYAAAVVVVTTGNLKVIPAQNADADVVTITGAPVGFVTPFQVPRVIATGTTAVVASLDV